MDIKKIFGLIFIWIFIFSVIGYSQNYEDAITATFKNILVKKDIKNISVKIPNYLSIEKAISDGKVFWDDSRTKHIIIFTEPNWATLPDDLQKVVSNSYEFIEKAYSPGINPIAIMWKRDWKSIYDRVDRMEKVDSTHFHGFVTKGIMKGKRQKYVYDYQLFNKENKKCLGVIIGSYGNYFLSDEESSYIISTIQGLE